MPPKRDCTPKAECPETCPGAETKFVDDGSEEHLYAVLCRHPEKLGRLATGAAYCGDGADQIVIHAAEFPSDEDIVRQANDTIYGH